jgi:two-component system, LytTR family, response regulator LytT
MPLRILIIEDEKLTARDLAATIRSLDDGVDILPFIHSVDEGLYFFSQLPSIDLIFSDIDLGDGLSFQIFRQYHVPAPIIFCTAFEQFMLDAFKTNGIDYILKPFRKEDVAKALEKYRSLKAGFSSSGLQKSLAELELSSAPKERSLLIQRGEKIVPIPFSDIAYFAIEHETTIVYTFGKERNFTSETLESLEGICGPTFFRANRQFLVNRKAVLGASRHFNRKLLVQLSIPYKEQVLVGKLKLAEFLRWLENTAR